MTDSYGEMEWWETSEVRPELERQMVQISKGRYTSDLVEQCRYFLSPLDPLAGQHWTVTKGWLDANAREGDPSSSHRYARMIKLGISDATPNRQPSRRQRLCVDASLSALATLSPPIKSETHLARVRRFRAPWSGDPIEDVDEREAENSHRRFCEAYRSWERSGRRMGQQRDDMLWWLGQVLWTVRSNIQHELKSVDDPDWERAEREVRVCEAILPVAKAIHDALFAYPDTRLATYGKLAPDQPGGQSLSAKGGVWSKGTIHGALSGVGDQKVLTLGGDGQFSNVSVDIFTSPHLPDQFGIVDHLEGQRYRRVLAPVDLPGSRVAIANVYVARSSPRRGRAAG